MEHQHIWDKVLSPSERVMYEFSVGARYRMVGLIGLSILGLLSFVWSWIVAVFIIAFSVFYFGFYLKVANAYAFTDRRVLVHKGWLSTKMITTEYQKITDVTVLEPLLQRLIFATGTLVVNTAGSKGEEIVLDNVERPYELKKKLDELRGYH